MCAGGWQQQHAEFSKFPGPVVMTTNCLIEPSKSYLNRIYTRSVVGWHGVQHIKSWDEDFQKVIDQALEMPGFAEDAPKEATMTVSYGQDGKRDLLSIAVMQWAGCDDEGLHCGGEKKAETMHGYTSLPAYLSLSLRSLLCVCLGMQGFARNAVLGIADKVYIAIPTRTVAYIYI